MYIEEKKPLKFINFLSVFGILLVVLGHSLETWKPNPVYNWIYSFHMPLFIFISGYLFSYTNKNSKEILVKKFISKKIKRLIIPFIFIFILKFLVTIVVKITSGDQIDFFNLIKSWILFPTPLVIGFPWFVLTLFFIFIIVVPIYKYIFDFRNLSNLLIFVLMLFLIHFFITFRIYLFNLNGLVWYFIFFLLGFLFNENEKRINQYLNLNKSHILLLTFIISLSFLYVNTFVQSLQSFFIALNGILFSISLSLIVTSKQIKFIRWEYLIPFTFQIYLIHWFLIKLEDLIFKKFFDFSNLFSVLILFCSSILFSVMICNIINKIQRKHTGLIRLFLSMN